MKKNSVKKKLIYFGLNIKNYFRLYFLILSILSVGLSIVASIINTSDLFKDLLIVYRILIVVAVYVAIAIIVIPFSFVNKKAIYYKNGEHEFCSIYGDMTRISSRRGKQKMIVVPVNTAFDMIIENPGFKALVSENTNHGRFIKRVCKEKGISQKQLNLEVQALLSKQSQFSPITKKKNKGNKKDYPIGTYVIYELNKISYLLFAFSRFNENNNAYPGEESGGELPLKELMQSINDSSQNCQVYIPLLGTGDSRYNLSNSESFNQIKHFFLSHKKMIKAKYCVLIYDGIKDEVSIFKNN